jgi:hypothetical protein
MQSRKDISMDSNMVFFILGCLIGALLQQMLDKYFEIIAIPQKVLIGCFILLLALLVYYLRQIYSKTTTNLDKLLNITLKEILEGIPCSFLTSQKERLKTLKNYIGIANKSIFIFSDLADKHETNLKEHFDYLSALDEKIVRNRKIEISRIVVPQFDMSKLTDSEIENKVKNLSAYKVHFSNLLEYRDEALILDKNGPEGISIMMLDERYLFLQIKKTFKNEILANTLEGGFFFEEIGKELSDRFMRFFKGRRFRFVIG